MREGIFFGRYLPGNSYIHLLDSRAKLIASLLIGSAVFFAESWPKIIGLLVLVIMIIYLAEISLKVIVKAWSAVWVFMGFLMIFQILFTPGTIIFEWGLLRITKEGLNLGGMLLLRIILVMALASVLTFTTSPVSIAGAMEILLKPLKKIKFPVHELSLMMTVSIRFLPTLYGEGIRIIKAQRSRGAACDRSGITGLYKTIIPVIVPLFAGVFRRAEELAVAMEARCYHGGEGRTSYNEYKYTGKDYVAIIVGFFILLLAAWE